MNLLITSDNTTTAKTSHHIKCSKSSAVKRTEHKYQYSSVRLNRKERKTAKTFQRNQAIIIK